MDTVYLVSPCVQQHVNELLVDLKPLPAKVWSARSTIAQSRSHYRRSTNPASSTDNGGQIHSAKSAAVIPSVCPSGHAAGEGRGHDHVRRGDACAHRDRRAAIRDPMRRGRTLPFFAESIGGRSMDEIKGIARVSSTPASSTSGSA